MLALTINLLAFRFVATVLSRQQQTYMQLTRLSKETLSREKKKEFCTTMTLDLEEVDSIPQTQNA